MKETEREHTRSVALSMKKITSLSSVCGFLAWGCKEFFWCVLLYWLMLCILLLDLRWVGFVYEKLYCVSVPRHWQQWLWATSARGDWGCPVLDMAGSGQFQWVPQLPFQALQTGWWPCWENAFKKGQKSQTGKGVRGGKWHKAISVSLGHAIKNKLQCSASSPLLFPKETISRVFPPYISVKPSSSAETFSSVNCSSTSLIWNIPFLQMISTDWIIWLGNFRQVTSKVSVSYFSAHVR